MANEFDYEKPSAPLPKQNYDLAALLSSMTDMEDEKAMFVGGLYGPAGSGKTTNAMELAQRITPSDKKILYVFTNQGWTALKNFPKLMHRVKKTPFENFDQLEALADMLQNEKYREGTGIETILFDEWNTMFDMDIEQITNFRSVQAAKGEGKKAPSYKDPDTPEWPEYNTAKMHMINVMNKLLATPVNLIFISHPRFQKKTGFTEPDFFEKASQAFMRVLHSLYYLDVSEENGKLVRRIQLQGTDRVVAKNRIGGLGMYANSIKEIAAAYHAWNADAKAVADGTLIGGEVVETEISPQELPDRSIPVEEKKDVVEESHIVNEAPAVVDVDSTSPVQIEESADGVFTEQADVSVDSSTVSGFDIDDIFGGVLS